MKSSRNFFKTPACHFLISSIGKECFYTEKKAKSHDGAVVDDNAAGVPGRTGTRAQNGDVGERSEAG